jgi:N-terminal domain of anti-restriction factor ArdC
MQEFADQTVAQLELDVKPWVRPWNPDLCLGPQAPRNAATGDHYHDSASRPSKRGSDGQLTKIPVSRLTPTVSSAWKRW